MKNLKLTVIPFVALLFSQILIETVYSQTALIVRINRGEGKVLIKQNNHNNFKEINGNTFQANPDDLILIQGNTQVNIQCPDQTSWTVPNNKIIGVSYGCTNNSGYRPNVISPR